MAVAHCGPEAQLLGLRRLLQGLQLLVVRALLPATRPQLRLPRTLVSEQACWQAAWSLLCLFFSTTGAQVGNANPQHGDFAILVDSTLAQPAATEAAARFSALSVMKALPNSMPGTLASV